MGQRPQMANELSFSHVHKSITSLEPITLPDFVVLTGVNGSGKTHLLTAIKGGQVKSSLVVDVNVDVRLFDAANIVPLDTGIFDPAQDQTRRSQWFQAIQSHREQHFPNLQSFAINIGIPAVHCTSIEKINALTPEMLAMIFGSEEKAVQVYGQLRAHIKNIGQAVANNSFNQIGDEYFRKNVPKIVEVSPEEFVVSSRSDFFRNRHFLWGDVDPFQQAFGQVFVTYRALIHDNDRLEKYPPPNDKHKRFLAPDEFVKEYGSPPWDFVNLILEESKLDFRVDSPSLYETGPYEPKLRKLSKDVEMKFADLSSGEKVLMSFALCLYNSQESRQAKKFPRLLLLDEVDAPLHPSMAASLLNTINNVLVKDKNVSVIMTTHSPSTVALAPEDAIYSMDPSGPRVKKISKGVALSLLTSGVPTLSVSFSGRRQIFVESRTDAHLYDRPYQKYKGRLSSERSLSFIEVGRTNEAGLEQSGGCDQVVRLVTTLTEAGNESVLGLVDWDGGRSATERVHVLAPGVRDGLESLLFDPLLIVALISRENPNFAKEKGLLLDEESYVSLGFWDSARWQRAVDNLHKIILGTLDELSDDLVEVRYLSGISLKISKKYLHMDDHALESRITNAFGFLKPKNKHTGDLMKHILDTVLADFELFLPSDLLEVFESLLKAQLE